MKGILLLIAMLLVLPVTMIGCATSGDLERVQADQRMLDAKVEQAVQDAQAAKASADAAKAKADNATARADSAIKAAEERERIADEKAKKADATFQKSMRK
ncbi:putative lipoprotein [Geobacter metallireducens RCH3]|uniref:Lipoprotein, putative n=1 Tax=Geobacter metallireducens (strain ATCC 53774 / DSM 7210 / GS-15) TaxID=269799 RepID=Q39PY3_GEOMG|nr:Lpp/OprI family alanine-zipper lipoprotein [Geobacter metallireducens]ABB33691.1 lipoprotein, putative [Geobacter metallireducens GS-15]EHP85792.1 putative lipoprotein [Geobacter metallireducens RCH3]